MSVCGPELPSCSYASCGRHRNPAKEGGREGSRGPRGGERGWEGQREENKKRERAESREGGAPVLARDRECMCNVCASGTV